MFPNMLRSENVLTAQMELKILAVTSYWVSPNP